MTYHYMLLTKRSLKLLFVVLLCTQIIGIAKAADEELKFGLGIGGGIQYAGFIGARLNWGGSRHNVYGSVGFLGIGFGYDYAISKQVTLGLNVSVPAVAITYGANVTYHFNAALAKGWHVGIDLLRFDNDSFVSDDLDSAVFISIGYRFR